MEHEIGETVVKTGGDYTFKGIVISAFHKLSGVERFAVENQEGLVHIFNGKQLQKVKDNG